MAAILLIDDNVDLCTMMAHALTLAGHQVHVAHDGKTASRLADCVPVDLVITDIVMPEQDGLETVMRLRKTHPGLPVIVISGDAPRHAPVYLTIASKLGATRTLLKPFSAAMLLETVNAMLPPSAGD
jgi:DNA-binding response OmpR family regulator